MRPPRYRFPEEVRTTTRAMAARMVEQGTIAQTPDQLDAWIADRPEVGEPLKRGGYGTAFDAADLLPLLEVFIGQAGGPVPPGEVPPRAPIAGFRAVLILGALVIVAALVTMLIVG